jgi:hypothetical protein
LNQRNRFARLSRLSSNALINERTGRGARARGFTERRANQINDRFDRILGGRTAARDARRRAAPTRSAAQRRLAVSAAIRRAEAAARAARARRRRRR